MNRSEQVKLPKRDEARVVTGLLFPSTGAKLPITLTVTTGIEEASEGHLMMVGIGDWVMANSGGGTPAAAFSMRGPGGDIPYPSRDVRDITMKSIHEEFKNGDKTTQLNILYDLSKNLDVISNALKPLRSGFTGGDHDELARTLMVSVMEATKGPGTAAGFIQESYRRISIMKGVEVALEIVPRLTEALQARLPEYFEHNPAHFDHGILEKYVRAYFGDVTVRDACKTLLLNAFNHETQQTEVMGAFLGDLADAPQRDSSFVELELGQTSSDYIPLYTKVKIADAILAMTSIDGLIGRHQVPGMNTSYKDMADFPGTLLRNTMDEVELRMQKHLQIDLEKKRGMASWFNNKPATITPALVQRLVILGNGYENHNRADRYAHEGVGSKIWQYPHGASRSALTPVYAGIRGRHERLSEYYTGLSSLVDINAPITPEANDIDAARYPSTSISDGSVAMQARHTWFGAHRIFKLNADKIADEMVFALHTLRDRGEMTGERFDKAEKIIRGRLQDPQKLKSLCDHLTLSEKQVEEAIGRTVPAKYSSAWKAVPSNVAARQQVLQAQPVQQAAARHRPG